MRITEEKERRQREANIRERMPRALQELRENLALCVEHYKESFGVEAAEMVSQSAGLRIVIREEMNGEWQEQSRVEVRTVIALPGFEIDRAGKPLVIEVGMLPGDKVYYRDREQDQYVTLEELTRRILDRAFFPKLGE